VPESASVWRADGVRSRRLPETYDVAHVLVSEVDMLDEDSYVAFAEYVDLDRRHYVDGVFERRQGKHFTIGNAS
jgi:hypothetical protein